MTHTSPSADGNAGEFFGLVWPGKQAARAAAEAPLSSEFELDAALSTSPTSPNSIHLADNLPVLQHWVTSGETFDVIYIDPPYNTGRDFVYRDNYRARREVNSGSYAQWHAEWLSMMLPRLILARRVLAENGFNIRLHWRGRGC